MEIFKEKIFYSENLSFRLLCDSDKEALSEILKDPETTEPAGFSAIKDRVGFMNFWDKLTQENMALAVLLNEKCIGYYHVNRYSLDMPEYTERKNCEIGFVIDRNYRRRGYAYETLTTLNTYLLRYYDSIFADCFAENEASRRLIEKCGFRYVNDYELLFADLREQKTIHSYVLTAECTD